MHIRELILTNFRGFHGVRSFQFAENFTVIAGINGRGKTSILDAIRFAAGRLIPQISKAGGQYPKITKYDVNHRAEDGAFKIELICNCAGYPITFKLEFDHHTNRKRPTKLPAALARTVRNAYGADPNTGEDAAPLVVCYTTDRAAFRLPKRLPNVVPTLDRAAFGGALVNRTIDFKDLAFRLLALVAADGVYDANMAGRMSGAFNRVIAIFLDGFSNLRVSEAPLGILVDKNGQTLELFELSDGERSVLAMATDLARRLTLANPMLPNPLDGAGVVLIDELELHLHPKWQRTLPANLKRTFPNIQFIGTTHSPQVLGEVPSSEVRLLGDAFETPGQSFGMDANWILDVLMDSQDQNIGVGNRVEQIFERIAGNDLEAARLSISEVRNLINGTNEELERAEALIERIRLLRR